MEDQTSDHVRYQVVVRGRLGDHLADAFGHLELDSRPGQTTLTGNIADQAQLHGLLDQLRDLGIHLISVNPVDQTPAPPSGESSRELNQTAKARTSNSQNGPSEPFQRNRPP